jgi:ribosomal-protein-alanine N-acetyltransferase
MTGTTIVIPTLTTERLTLRAPRLDDLDAYAAFRSSARSVGVGGPYPREGAFDKLAAIVGHWQLRGYGRWMVADRDTDIPLGLVGIMYPDDWPEPEIAWSLFDAAEGRGLAYEAALECRRYAYDVLGWETIISCTVPDNVRSIALAERMGAVLDGRYDHSEYGPLDIYRHPSREALH